MISKAILRKGFEEIIKRYDESRGKYNHEELMRSTHLSNAKFIAGKWANGDALWTDTLDVEIHKVLTYKMGVTEVSDILNDVFQKDIRNTKIDSIID